jgi:hypothetical protein
MSDITQLQGNVGQSTANAGDNRAVTLTKNVALRTAGSQALFQDAVERGNTYGVCSQAGVTSQAGLSATTPVLTLANPTGSGVNGVLWFAGATFTVAFATAGAIWLAHSAVPATLATLTTAHRNLKLAGSQGNKLKALLACTLPAAPVGVALLGVGLTGAITTTPMVQTLGRWFNGGIIVEPGQAISIQTGVASGTSGTFCEFIWEEVAV